MARIVTTRQGGQTTVEVHLEPSEEDLSDEQIQVLVAQSQAFIERKRVRDARKQREEEE